MFDPEDNVCIKLLEVEDPKPLAGSLFQKSFSAEIPDFPKHFVLVASKDQSSRLTLGYVHFIEHKNIYLGGGMCVDTQALRNVPKHLRKKLNEHGGVAYYMLSNAVKKLHDCDAIFGYVGHHGAYKIDLAVGFEQTKHQHLIVFWKKQLDQVEQQNIIQTAYEFGPF